MSQSTETLTPSQRMLLALKEARAKLDASERTQKEPIAIIGMGCHFPGGADTPDAYWRRLREGFDAITPVPPDRWRWEDYYDPDPVARGKMYLRSAGFIDQDLKSFDAGFFHISPPEAAAMDPQQRLLLEVSWEALENANQTPADLFGTPAGVFVGISSFDQAARLFGPSSLGSIDVFSGNGAAFSVAAGRISYWLGLTGPSLCVDTACSSSLVALHLACQSLRQRECSLALAGGVNILLSPGLGITFCKARMIAPDGRCKTFDAAANGFVRGEGCGMLVLKRLSDALAAGDRILSLVRGSAVNHDGASGGLTVPSGPSQQAVIRRALTGIPPEQVGYVEAHGTGTSLGDPIEVGALGTVFQERAQPLFIGSVKTNIGHLEAAAGVAGVMKTVLAMQHGEIPRHLHFQTPNSHIPWDELPVNVVTQLTPWPASAPFAGVSSFGVSGTNAHVVLEPAPPRNPSQSAGAAAPDAGPDRPLHLLPLSAKSGEALGALAKRYVDFLRAESGPALADICYTASVKRGHFDHRLCVVGGSKAEVADRLADFCEGRAAEVQIGQSKASTKIAFLFTGQGAQHVGMGRTLYETQPAFAATLDRCDEILRPLLGASILSVLYPERAEGAAEDTSPAQIDQTAFTQPALFALEYALAELLLSWGLVPDVVIGHSVGEYVAACVAGVFTLEEGLNMIAARGRLMQALPAGGVMLAVQASEAHVKKVLAESSRATSGMSPVEIAAVNAPKSVVIAGLREAVQAVAATLAAEGIKTRPLAVSHAFHSALMDPMLDAFEQAVSGIAYRQPKIKLVSNVTGKVIDAEVTSARYWRDHVRKPVRFADGMATLNELGVQAFIEIGPQPTLIALGQMCLPGATSAAWLPSLRNQPGDWKQLLESVAALYVRGAAIDWAGFEKEYRALRQAVVLPNYPFQRKRHWVDVPDGRALSAAAFSTQSATEPRHPFFKRQLHSPALSAGDKCFENEVSLARVPYIAEHEFFDSIILPGVTYLEMVYKAARSFLPGPLPVIKNFVIQQALLLPKDSSGTTLQLVCKPQPDAGYQWQLYSASADDPTSFTLHATGEIISGEPPPLLPQVTLSAVQARCAEEDVRGIYQALAQTGMNAGPTFENIVHLRVGKGEALGQVRLPEQLVKESSEYTFLHFMLLDACLQVVQTLMPRDCAHLPLGIDELHVYQPNQTHTTLFSYVKYRSGQRETGSYRVDIQLLDETGQLVAALVGVRFQQATKKSIRGASRPQDLLYELGWQAAPLPDTVPTAESSGRWLILADAQGTGVALAEQLGQRGETCELLVRPAGAAAWNIDPQRTYRGIVYLRALDTYQEGALDGNAAVPRIAEELCVEVLELLQTIIQMPAPPRLWLVTRQAVSVAGDRPVQVQQAPLFGLGRTIGTEHPELKCTCIDLAAETQVESLAAALQFADDESQVLLRGGERLVGRLVPYRTVLPASGGKPRLDPAGSYLITGGLGGLGLKVAAWLAAQGARHLVLCGRRGVTSSTTEKTLAELAEAGVTVQVVQADVSQAAEVEELIAACQARAPLRGVIHAAGLVADGILRHQSRARFAAVMAPKVAGGWHLHRATRELPLDFFIAFSSIAALFGLPGQGNYAAANAFLDGLAHHRRANGLPALSIDWGAWSEVGMAAESARTSRILEGLNPEDGVQLLGILMAQNLAQVAALQISWSQFGQQFPVATDIPLFSQVLRRHRLQKYGAEPSPAKPTGQEIRRSLSAAPAAERPALLKEQIQDEIEQVLGMRLDEDDLFAEAGIDSLTSIQLSNRLAAKLDLALPATLLFDYATLGQLTEHLLQRITGTDTKTHGKGVAPEVVAKTEQGWLPLSYVQQQFILPESSAAPALVNVCSVYALQGSLDAAALKRACQALLLRYDSLRLTVAKSDGVWMQRVRDDANISLEIIDAKGWSRAELTGHVQTVWQRPFDLLQDLPVRAYLFRHASDSHTLALTYHHIVTDGWSHRLVSEELPLLYEAAARGVPAALPELPWSYVDHLQWEAAMLAGKEGERLWQYFRSQLPGQLPVLDLPTDRPFPPRMSHRGRDYVCKLGSNLDWLKEVCRSQGVTPYAVILAALQLLLHGYSGQSDMVVGCEAQNRIRPEHSRLVGSLADHSVSRSVVASPMMFPHYLQEVRSSLLGIFAHQGYPRLLLAERLGEKPVLGADYARKPLVQVVLNYLGKWGESDVSADASTEEARILPGAVRWQHLELEWPHLGCWEDYFTLVVAEIPGDGLMGFAAYNTDVFEEETMARMMADYRTLLAAIVENPVQSLDALLGKIGRSVPR